MRARAYTLMASNFVDTPEVKLMCLEKALSDLDFALELLSKEEKILGFNLHSSRAEIYRYLKDYTAAESDLLISLGPALDCSPLFQIDQAGSDLKTRNDFCVEAALGLAEIYMIDSPERYDDTTTLIQLALQLATHPTHKARALIRLATVQSQLGDKEQACATLHQIPAEVYIPPGQIPPGICNE